MALLGRIRQTLSRLDSGSALSVYSSRRAASTLFVGGLAWALDEGTVRDAFSSFGEVREVRIVQDRETGKSKGYGFVTYASEEDAKNALESMDGKVRLHMARRFNFSVFQELSGREIRVNYAARDHPGRITPGFTDGGTGGFAR